MAARKKRNPEEAEEMVTIIGNEAAIEDEVTALLGRA